MKIFNWAPRSSDLPFMISEDGKGQSLAARSLMLNTYVARLQHSVPGYGALRESRAPPI